MSLSSQAIPYLEKLRTEVTCETQDLYLSQAAKRTKDQQVKDLKKHIHISLNQPNQAMMMMMIMPQQEEKQDSQLKSSRNVIFDIMPTKISQSLLDSQKLKIIEKQNVSNEKQQQDFIS